MTFGARTVLLSLAAAAAVTVGAVVLRQRERAEHLRGEAVRLERLAADQNRLRDENDRLRDRLADAGDLAALRGRFAELQRMREASDRLGLQNRSLKRTLGQKSDPVWPSGVEVRRAADWRYLGQADPADTVESVLMCVRSGDIERLAELIDLDPDTRKKAESLFAGPPEKALATLMAAQIPADYAAIAAIDQSNPDPDTALLTMRLEEGNGAQRDLPFKLERTEGGWRLDVPENIVVQYAALLGAASSSK